MAGFALYGAPASIADAIHPQRFAADAVFHAHRCDFEPEALSGIYRRVRTSKLNYRLRPKPEHSCNCRTNTTVHPKRFLIGV